MNRESKDMRNYKDINDWVLVDYRITEPRLSTNNDLFLTATREFSKVITNKYGFEKIGYAELGGIINYFNKNMGKLRDAEFDNGTKKSRVLDGLDCGGIFCVSPMYRNFRNYDVTFFTRETPEMIAINKNLMYFKDCHLVYGPTADGTGVDALQAMEDAYTSTIPELNTNDEVKAVMDRIELIRFLRRYDRRLFKISENVEKIFTQHREKINKEIEEGKATMLAKDWIKLNDRKVREFNSLTDRFYMSTKAIADQSQN